MDNSDRNVPDEPPIQSPKSPEMEEDKQDLMQQDQYPNNMNMN